MTWTRRDFLRTSFYGLAAGTFTRSFAHAQSYASGFRELRANVGIFTARGGTIGWLVNPDGAVVVDTQFPDTATTFLAGLRERTPARLDALINSHHHGDHTGGNAVFREAARHIVAHGNVPELQRRVAASNPHAPAQTYADTTFDREWAVQVGNERVRAKHFGAAHTGGDCTITFERAEVVHMGDLVFNRAYPFVDIAGGASVPGWIALLEAVTAEHGADTLYVFGHASSGFEVTGTRADVLLQRDFLSAVLEHAERAVSAGRSREEATAVERFDAFPDHAPIADWLTLAAPLGAAYDELSASR